MSLHKNTRYKRSVTKKYPKSKTKIKGKCKNSKKKLGKKCTKNSKKNGLKYLHYCGNYQTDSDKEILFSKFNNFCKQITSFSYYSKVLKKNIDTTNVLSFLNSIFTISFINTVKQMWFPLIDNTTENVQKLLVELWEEIKKQNKLNNDVKNEMNNIVATLCGIPISDLSEVSISKVSELQSLAAKYFVKLIHNCVDLVISYNRNEQYISDITFIFKKSLAPWEQRLDFNNFNNLNVFMQETLNNSFVTLEKLKTYFNNFQAFLLYDKDNLKGGWNVLKYRIVENKLNVNLEEINNIYMFLVSKMKNAQTETYNLNVSDLPESKKEFIKNEITVELNAITTLRIQEIETIACLMLKIINIKSKQQTTFTSRRIITISEFANIIHDFFNNTLFNNFVKEKEELDIIQPMQKGLLAITLLQPQKDMSFVINCEDLNDLRDVTSKLNKLTDQIIDNDTYIVGTMEQISFKIILYIIFKSIVLFKQKYNYTNFSTVKPTLIDLLNAFVNEIKLCKGQFENDLNALIDLGYIQGAIEKLIKHYKHKLTLFNETNYESLQVDNAIIDSLKQNNNIKFFTTKLNEFKKQIHYVETESFKREKIKEKQEKIDRLLNQLLTCAVIIGVGLLYAFPLQVVGGLVGFFFYMKESNNKA